MHYKNGREAKNGDKVVMVPLYGGSPVSGILYDATAGNDHCNGRIALTNSNDPYANLSDCLHVDDARAVLTSAAPDTSKAVAEAAVPEPVATVPA